MKKFLIPIFIVTLGLFVAKVIAQEKSQNMETAKTAPEQPTKKVEKTDADWQKELTPEQYRVLRKSGTEAPHSQTYKEFNQQKGGTYYCAGCGAKLFTSAHKFDSHCGWPAFYDAADNKNVKLVDDVSLGMIRTEVRCATCDGHLGHLFKGEGFDTPKDQRYCINGVTLTFVPAGEEKNVEPAEKKEK